MALTPKQERFVDEYLVDLNATAAAGRAGYRQPNAQGPRLLVNVGVAAAIAAAQVERGRRTQLSADQVLRELALVATSDVTRYEVDDRGRLTLPEGADPALFRAVSSYKRKVRSLGGDDGGTEVETEIKLWPKVQALELLARHLGMLIERLEVKGGMTVEVVERVVRTREDARAALAAVEQAGRVP